MNSSLHLSNSGQSETKSGEGIAEFIESVDLNTIVVLENYRDATTAAKAIAHKLEASVAIWKLSGCSLQGKYSVSPLGRELLEKFDSTLDDVMETDRCDGMMGTSVHFDYEYLRELFHEVAPDFNFPERIINLTSMKREFLSEFLREGKKWKSQNQTTDCKQVHDYTVEDLSKRSLIPLAQFKEVYFPTFPDEPIESALNDALKASRVRMQERESRKNAFHARVKERKLRCDLDKEFDHTLLKVLRDLFGSFDAYISSENIDLEIEDNDDLLEVLWLGSDVERSQYFLESLLGNTWQENRGVPHSGLSIDNSTYHPEPSVLDQDTRTIFFSVSGARGLFYELFGETISFAITFKGPYAKERYYFEEATTCTAAQLWLQGHEEVGPLTLQSGIWVCTEDPVLYDYSKHIDTLKWFADRTNEFSRVYKKRAIQSLDSLDKARTIREQEWFEDVLIQEVLAVLRQEKTEREIYLSETIPKQDRWSVAPWLAKNI